MLYIVIITGIFAVYNIIVAIFAERGRRADVVNKRLAALAENPREKFLLDEELSQPLSTRFIKPLVASVNATFTRLFAKKNSRDELKNQKKSQRDAALRKTLAQAGLAISPANYKILRGVIMGAAAITALVVGSVLKLETRFLPLIVIFAPIVAYVAVRYITAAMASGRKAKLEHELPDILDILSISVEAGLGFEQSIQHITLNMSGPMIDEFHVAYREMSMGRTRREALQALADRCDFEDIRTFTGAIIQAGQLGISIKNVLRSQSAAMRLSRKSKAQEKAQKISTKILIPMVIFIFPVLFIILMGPAAVNIIETLG